MSIQIKAKKDNIVRVYNMVAHKLKVMKLEVDTEAHTYHA